MQFQQNNGWVNVFLIYADFIENNGLVINKKLADEINLLLKDLYDCLPGTASKKIYIICSTHNYEKKENDAWQLEDNCFLFQLSIDDGGFVKTALLYNTHVGIHENGLLTNFFEKIQSVEEDYVPEKVCLHTWGHGAAFGIFQTQANKRLQVEEWIDIYNDKRFTYLQKLFAPALKQKNISNIPYALPNAYMLSNEALSNAILQGLGKIAVITMMNCYMMNVHTMYVLRNCSAFLVAPQGIIKSPGYAYKAIFTDKKNSTSELLAIAFINSSFSDARIESYPFMKTWAVFAARLSENMINELVKKIDIAGNTLFQSISFDRSNNQKYSLATIARQSFYFGEDNYTLDLLNLVRFIEFFNRSIDQFDSIFTIPGRELSVSLAESAGKLFQINNVTVSFIGDAVYKNFWGLSKLNPSGLCIYFPFGLHEKSFHHQQYKMQMTDDSTFIAQCTGWRKLIEIITKTI